MVKYLFSLILLGLTPALLFSVQAAQWQQLTGATVQQGARVTVRNVGYYTDNKILQAPAPTAEQPLRLVIMSSTYAVTNAHGKDSAGRPYFDVAALTTPVRVYFANSRGTFSYSAAVFQQLSDNNLPDPTLQTPVSYQNATVHDPSVIRLTDGRFYVFGSHLAVAKSTDLMNWQLVAEGVNNANPLFATYQSEAAEGIAWSGGHAGSWASDVIQLADGKYYFYYNHCASPENGECDSSRSYLGVAVSEQIEGPYRNLGLMLKSGHRGSENPGVDGNVYNGNIHPNAIDPDVFFDKTGRLWMVYGSYSGGIFVLELNPQTGFALPGQGYGTKIMGGYFSAIEGPFMFYSPESDYYYLFTSFGGFAQKDGYNMRIARARTPQGPFFDAEGRNMLGASGGWSSIAPFGVKLMGGHLFEHNPGDPGSDHGYMAPGHNSAYYDAATKQHFVIFHARFPDKGEGHEIRVHQLFVNADGWLVAAPHRYAPVQGDNVVDKTDVLGTYQFINHGKDINRTPHRSVYLTLNADGSISGDLTGSYQLGDKQQITLNINGVGSFNGVRSWQYNDNTAQLVPTFSALSIKGEAVWGSRLPVQSAADLVQQTLNSLTLPAETVTDLVLATRGAQGAVIQWSSSVPQVIAANGKVEAPSAGSSDAVVELTATVSLLGVQQQKTFSVLVKARKAYNRTALYRFEQDLTDSTGLLTPGQATGSRPDSSGVVSFASGKAGQALQLNGQNGVRLPDGLIRSHTYTVSLWLKPAVLTQFTPAFFAAANPDNWLSLVPRSWDQNTMLWSGSQVWFDGSAGLQIPLNQWTHVAFSVQQGQLSLYINGVQKFTGSNFRDLFSQAQAVFALGVNYWDIPFNGAIDELAVYETALSAAEIKALDVDRLQDAQLLQIAVNNLNLGDITAVRADLALPRSAAFASVVQWQSSDLSTIDLQGKVTRPGLTEPDRQVTLTATVNLNGLQQSRDFVVTVRSLAPPTPLANFSFDLSNLADATGRFNAGSSTGSKLDQAGGALSYQSGVRGQALVLNGSSGVRLPDNLITDHSYSVALWLNPAQLTNYTTAFFGYANLSSWVSLVPRGHGGVGENTMLWSGTAWYDAGIGQRVALNSWSHLTFVVSGGTVKIYLNGQVVFSGSNFPNVFGVTGNKGFGLGVNFWDTPFKGMLDEVTIYSEAISAEDVLQLYQQSVLP